MGDIKRREFIALLGGALVAWPVTARAQQHSGRMVRIGLLMPSLDNPVVARGYPAFLEELKRSGFIEGQNLTIEFVRIDQDIHELFAETADLVRSNIELLVVTGPETALQAAMAAKSNHSDRHVGHQLRSIAHGYVKSLPKPGGTVTGIVSLQTELAAKQVELLTEAFRQRTRLAILWDGLTADQFAAADRQAKLLRLDVQSLKLENPPYDFDTAFRSIAGGSSQMLLVLSSPFFAAYGSHIAELAIQQRLPTMFIFKTYVEAGGLISYGVDPKANFRQLGFYASKILNGAKPADLPVEQAVKFELVVNLKTAKAIDVELSTAILVRADEVIE